MDQTPKLIANILLNDLKGHLNKRKLTISECPIAPEDLAEIAFKIDKGFIDKKEAKEILKQKFEEYDRKND